MQVFQFIRQLDYNTPVVIYDIDRKIICEVENKTSIPIDIYECDVLKFGIENSILYVEIVK